MSDTVETLTQIKYLIDEYIEKHEELSGGYDAWYDEDASPEAQASCDPSDQFLLGEACDSLLADIKEKIEGI